MASRLNKFRQFWRLVPSRLFLRFLAGSELLAKQTPQTLPVPLIFGVLLHLPARGLLRRPQPRFVSSVVLVTAQLPNRIISWPSSLRTTIGKIIMAVLQWSVDASQLRDTARNMLEPVNRAVFSLVSLALSLSILSNNGASQVGIQTQQYLLGLGKPPSLRRDRPSGIEYSC